MGQSAAGEVGERRRRRRAKSGARREGEEGNGVLGEIISRKRKRREFRSLGR